MRAVESEWLSHGKVRQPVCEIPELSPGNSIPDPGSSHCALLLPQSLLFFFFLHILILLRCWKLELPKFRRYALSHHGPHEYTSSSFEDRDPQKTLLPLIFLDNSTASVPASGSAVLYAVHWFSHLCNLPQDRDHVTGFEYLKVPGMEICKQKTIGKTDLF